ncbi:MAG: NUDIX hydrolase [Verrucomicrobiota bacterium]
MNPYKISTLLFAKDWQNRILLMQRRKAPNLGLWSPPGGKLEMSTGESPFECAVREAKEELGLELDHSSLHLFSMIAEKAYEAHTHWLMFMFEIKPVLETLPKEIDEGPFQFFSRNEIDELAIPETDRTLVWPFYDHHRDGFTAIRANFDSQNNVELVVEESL